MAKQMEGTMRMIVIGADTHKDTHTAVAVAGGTGQLVDELTAAARKPGFAQHLDWARDLDSERVWAGPGSRQCGEGRSADPPAREFLARKQAEGKSRMEALRCLKRHLARKVWRLLVESQRERSVTTVDTQRGSLAPQIAVAA